MASLPERTPKKTVPSIVALLSNGCKQAFPLLTVYLQRARHNNLVWKPEMIIVEAILKKLNVMVRTRFNWFRVRSNGGEYIYPVSKASQDEI
jgi:hypothetical protein